MGKLEWTLPVGVSKEDALRDEVEAFPQSPKGLSEEQMQEALLQKEMWMLSRYYENDTGALEGEMRSVYQWLKEASGCGYSGYVWDYLNLEFLKVDARLYMGVEKWTKAGEDLDACLPYLDRIAGALRAGAAVPAEDRACLRAACAETEVLRYFQKKHTGSTAEAYRLLGGADRFLPEDPQEKMSTELRAVFGVLGTMTGIKWISLRENKRAEADMEKGFLTMKQDEYPFWLGVSGYLYTILCLYTEGMWRHNYPLNDQKEMVAFIVDHNKRMLSEKQVLDTFADISGEDGVSEAILTISYAMLINREVSATMGTPETDPEKMAEQLNTFRIMLTKAISQLRDTPVRRCRGWDWFLELVREHAYTLRLSLCVTLATLYYVQEDYGKVRTETEECLKEINQREVYTDSIQQLSIQLSCQYLLQMAEAGAGNYDKAYYISRQALDMVRNADLGFIPAGMEISLASFHLLAGQGSLAEKNKPEARKHAEEGLAMIELIDPLLREATDSRGLEKEFKRLLRKSKGLLF